MRKNKFLLTMVTVGMLSLTACNGEENVDSTTGTPIEVIKPTESITETTETIKETVESLIIEERQAQDLESLMGGDVFMMAEPISEKTTESVESESETAGNETPDSETSDSLTDKNESESVEKGSESAESISLEDIKIEDAEPDKNTTVPNNGYTSDSEDDGGIPDVVMEELHNKYRQEAQDLYNDPEKRAKLDALRQ